MKPDVYGTVETIATEHLAQAPFKRVDENMDKMKGIELTYNNTGHGLSIRGGDIRETAVVIDSMSIRDTRSENATIGPRDDCLDWNAQVADTDTYRLPQKIIT
ncbi:hypothetical protein ACFL45_09970 [Candidatus Neomarinimicrobiota bacterium]